MITYMNIDLPWLSRNNTEIRKKNRIESEIPIVKRLAASIYSINTISNLGEREGERERERGRERGGVLIYVMIYNISAILFFLLIKVNKSSHIPSQEAMFGGHCVNDSSFISSTLYYEALNK